MALVLTDAMVAFAIRFGVYYAKRRGFARRRTDEFVVAALEGMWRATLDFVPTKGASFNTYARIRMAGKILDWYRHEQEYPARTRKSHERTQAKRGRPVRLLKRVPLNNAALDTLVVPPHEVDESDDALHVKRILRSLPRRDQLIVTRIAVDGRTMKEVAMMFDISESRVCQIFNKALRLLREREPQPEAVRA